MWTAAGYHGGSAAGAGRAPSMVVLLSAMVLLVLGGGGGGGVRVGVEATTGEEIAAANGGGERRRNVFEIINQDPQLSQFSSLLREYGGFAQVLMQQRAATVFAPTNEAFERTHLEQKFMNREKFILYHISNTIVRSDMFHLYKTIPSDMEGSLPLWLWLKTNFREKEYYVNDARIIEMDIQGETNSSSKQVLHIIDEVLEPIIAKDTDSSYNNPDALKFMSNLIAFNFHNYQLDEFLNLVERSPRRQAFTSSEGSTYFMPVNSGFSKVNRSYIDNKVIDIHVIFDKVLFTRAFGRQEFESYTNVDSVKVQLSLINETSYSGNKVDGYDLYIQSNAKENYYNTIKQGVVVAKILKANVPVKNGVVHIIDRPLVAADISAREVVEEEKSKRLSELYALIHDSAPSILEILQTASPITFFAPSNEAFHNLPAAQRDLLQKDSNASRKLLELHIVPQSLHIETIAHQVSMSVVVHDNMRKLSLRVLDVNEPPYKNYTVEGGGVNATIITPNIIAKNGVIHIINRVLGVPVDSMYDMLKNDDDMDQTFEVTSQDYWNEQFKNMNRFFTFFVPSDDAWVKLKEEMPSEYKKLVSADQAYHVQQIMERHLTTNGQFYVQDLKKMEHIRMIKGTLEIKSKNGGDCGAHGKGRECIVKWGREEATIVRPDIRTTNGIIHVIDRVLMERSDMAYGNIAAAASQLTASLATLLLLAAAATAGLLVVA